MFSTNLMLKLIVSTFILCTFISCVQTFSSIITMCYQLHTWQWIAFKHVKNVWKITFNCISLSHRINNISGNPDPYEKFHTPTHTSPPNNQCPFFLFSFVDLCVCVRLRISGLFFGRLICPLSLLLLICLLLRSVFCFAVSCSYSSKYACGLKTNK